MPLERMRLVTSVLRLSPLPMGMSPDVGVRVLVVSVMEEAGVSSPRRSACVEGESCGARCDFRLCFSMSEMAHASMSTGVRFAAWRKGSLSCSR